MLYDGFISYSHAREAAVARAIQSALHRFARPWFRLRALRVFRDVTNLSANPGLWSAIERALGEARFFLLLASPQSAASPWVQREVEWWLRHRAGDHLLLVIVDGEIRWNAAAGDFDWGATTVLPRGLAGAFREEPLYADFRGLATPAELSLANPAFAERIAGLAATLHGRAKDEMIGEDVRQHRRTMRVAGAAIVALALLAAAAATAAVVAVHQRNVAEQRRQLAAARELVARGELLRGDRPELHPAALLLAAEGLRRTAALGAPTHEADQALRRVLALTPEPVAVFEHDEPVVAFAVSPDGSRLAAGTRHGYVRLWRRGDGGEARTLDFAHADFAGALAFSPDGTRLASGGWDGVVVLVDAVGGKVLGELVQGRPVWAVAFSPDGRWLVSAGADGLARVWDLRSGREAATLQHGATVAGVRWSGDGRRIVLQGADGVASLIDATTMSRLGQLTLPNRQLFAAVFSADGSRLATRGLDHTFLMDLAAEKEIARIAERPGPAGAWVEDATWTADAIAFSADSRWLFVANRDRSARVVDAVTGSEARMIPHDQPVRGVAASPDGTLLATRSGSVVRLWEAASGAEVGRLSHEHAVSHVAFAADGLIATVTGAQVRLWRTATANPALALPHGRGVWDRLFSPDGRWLLTQDPALVVSLWDAATGRRVAQLRHPDLVRQVRFSRDARHLATGCNDRGVRVWELPSGRLAGKLDAPQLPGPLAFAHGGAQLAAVFGSNQPDDPGGVIVWDWKTARQLLRRDTAKQGLGSAFSPDDRLLAFWDAAPALHVLDLAGNTAAARDLDGFASGGDAFCDAGNSLLAWREKTLALVDVASGRPRFSTELDVKIGFAEAAPNSDLVAVVTDDRAVRLWTARKGGGVIALPHELPVNSIRFSPDGHALATGSGHPIVGRGEARVWSVPDGALATLQPHDRGVWVVDFNHDGSRLATLCRDLPTRTWIVSRSALLAEAAARATRNLTFAEWQQFLPGEPYPRAAGGLPVHGSVVEAASARLLDGDERGAMRLFAECAANHGAGAPAPAAVRSTAARTLVAHALAQAQDGKVARALEALRRARTLDGGLVVDAGTWNRIAWAGATHGHAREVAFAAERAVELEPANLNYRDTRGLVRALMGNTAGAMADFKAYTAGAEGHYPTKMIEKRHLWLAALALDKNPFTEDVLRALREE